LRCWDGVLLRDFSNWHRPAGLSH